MTGLSQASTPYYLARNVFVHCTKDGAIFLDLSADAYIGIGASDAQALSAVVAGWPQLEQSAEKNAGNADSVASALIERGLLTTDKSKGRSAETAPLVPAAEAIVYRYDPEVPRIRPHHLLRFVTSCLRAWANLRFRPLHSTVARIEKRKQRRRADGNRTSEAELRELVRAFYWIRPFFYAKGFTGAAGGGKCLFDSIVLLDFLAGYRVYPTWVIGVKTRPFAAHSWVQERHLVLNGTPGFVGFYSPILTL